MSPVMKLIPLKTLGQEYVTLLISTQKIRKKQKLIGFLLRLINCFNGD